MKSSDVKAHILAGCIASPGFVLAIGTELWLRSLSPEQLDRLARKNNKILFVLAWSILFFLGGFADAVLKDVPYKQISLLPWIILVVLSLGGLFTWGVTIRTHRKLNEIAKELNL